MNPTSHPSVDAHPQASLCWKTRVPGTQPVTKMSPPHAEKANSSLLLSEGGTFQDRQWRPETADNTEPFIHCVFSYTDIPMIKCNLSVWHSKMNGNNEY